MSTGLVLSGGGFRGIAHIGVIKALEEYGIKPSYIAGTSSGAIIGALYAAGYKYDKIQEILESIHIFSVYKYARNKPGFVDTEKFIDEFARYFPENSFSALKIPLFVTTTNILSGKLEVFSKGQLIRPILASAAFPGVFSPIQIGDQYYIDGGTLNNFPVDLIRDLCEEIIGVYVNPFQKISFEEVKNSLHVLERAYQIRSANNANCGFKDCDILILPDGLNKYGTFSLKNMDPVVELGYRSAVQGLERKLERSKT